MSRGSGAAPPPRPHHLRGGGAAVRAVASARGRGAASEAGLEVVVAEVARDLRAERDADEVGLPEVDPGPNTRIDALPQRLGEAAPAARRRRLVAGRAERDAVGVEEVPERPQDRAGGAVVP